MTQQIIALTLAAAIAAAHSAVDACAGAQSEAQREAAKATAEALTTIHMEIEAIKSTQGASADFEALRDKVAGIEAGLIDLAASVEALAEKRAV